MTNNDTKEEQFESNNDNIIQSPEINSITKIKNPRSNLTAKKYQKQLNWRRIKVKELLFKGYDQQEIISILHVSQSTISRDVACLYNQQEKGVNDYGKLLYENHFNIVNGSTELLKKAWEILDNPKADFKMKDKMMNFIMDCYLKRIELFQGLPYFVILKTKIDEVNRKEKYFKDNNIEINYEIPMSMEEFHRRYEESTRADRDKEAVF